MLNKKSANYIFYALILHSLVHTYNLHAMDDLEFIFKLEQKDTGQAQAQTAAENPLLRVPPPPPSIFQPPAAPEKPKNVLIFKRPNTQNCPNPFLSPPKKKKSFLLDSDDEQDYIPIPQPKPINVPITPPKAPLDIELEIESITNTLNRETLRKFTYDMEAMQELDARAYAITIGYLQMLREEDKDFLYTLKINTGTPDIIRYIESKTSYRFPENIVVRTKQYPYACSLASVAFCTEKRVYELKKFLVHSSRADIYKLDKEVPSCAYLIEQAILAYLDQLDALEKETPAQRRKRIYKKASEFESCQPADDAHMAENS